MRLQMGLSLGASDLQRGDYTNWKAHTSNICESTFGRHNLNAKNFRLKVRNH